MATRRRIVFVLLALPGCSGPIAETGPGDPLPPPPIVAVVPALPPAVPAEPEPIPPVAAAEQAPADPPAHPEPAGPSSPAVIPGIRLQTAGPFRPAPEPPAEVAADDHYHRDFSVPGDHVLFQKAAGSDQIWLALDRETFSRFVSAGLRGDGKSYWGIVETGNVRFVAPTTPGVVLAVEPRARCVRISEGPLAGMEGWIDEPHLRAAPAPVLTAQAKAERERELSRRKVTKAVNDQAKIKATMDFFGVRPSNRPR